ncbi:hypothetical protein GQX73_g2821 [Xylaria multiplex]|uniref:C2H2-type domain-containing protein n=1 Tax=Xylaria multiplex TaxID=323545 RepID=A0A7C8MUK2_9PEZI|nr:hypothetical protein GQX73_g2821 [Xylaria multiplex]
MAKTPQHESPPFEQVDQLNRDLSVNLAVRHGVQDTADGWDGCLARDLETRIADDIYPYLWLRRTVVVTEDPKLHLVWFYETVYIKPLPDYLLNYAIWREHIPKPSAEPEHTRPRYDKHRAAVGFLRSYGFLIQYESDFIIAQRANLLPKYVSFQCFQKFIQPFRSIHDDDVSHRYHYGQFRLTRLDWAVRIIRIATIVHLVRTERQLPWNYRLQLWQTSHFLQYYAAPLIFIFATLSLILSSMQVVLAALGSNTWEAFVRVSWEFSVATIIFATLPIFGAIFGPYQTPVCYSSPEGLFNDSRTNYDLQHPHPLAPYAPEPGKLSCPYRKRNPARFNVRSFPNCATNGFGDLPTLKRHIRTYHRRRPGYTCARCRKTFERKEELDEHLRALPTQLCDVLERDNDPEDGINEEIENILAERKNNRKVSSWEELWRVLFTDDKTIPSPSFVVPKIVEISEVYNAIQNVHFNESWGMDMMREDGNIYSSPRRLCDSVTKGLMTELKNVYEKDITTTQPSPGMPNPPRLAGSSSSSTFQSSVGALGETYGSISPRALFRSQKDLSRRGLILPRENDTSYLCQCGSLRREFSGVAVVADQRTPLRELYYTLRLAGIQGQVVQGKRGTRLRWTFSIN